MLRIHDIPLPIGGVTGFAVDIDELDQTRLRMRRLGEAQRTMLDRLSAGVAQFTPERTLAFCNLPFRRLFAMRNEWLADKPEFDRVLERRSEERRVGKECSVRVDLGGRRIIKQKNKRITSTYLT